MKHRNEAGFSLVEVLVAITLLAAVVLPVCSALLMAVRMNDRADELMRAQLAVSSAAETLMAEGIPAGTPKTEADGDYGGSGTGDLFPAVRIVVEPVESSPYYNVVITSNDGLVTVETVVNVIPDADDTQTEPETEPSTDPTEEEGEE